MEKMFKEFLSTMSYNEFVLFLLKRNAEFEEIKDGKFNLIKCNGFIIKFSCDIFVSLTKEMI